MAIDLTLLGATAAALRRPQDPHSLTMSPAAFV